MREGRGATRHAQHTAHTDTARDMKTIRSKPCPECTTDDALRRYPDMDGFWTAYPDEGIKKCNNCGHTESYQQRSPRDGREHGMSPSQEAKMESIRKWADEKQHSGLDIETEHLGWGRMSVTLEINPDSPLLRDRVHLFITRYGRVDVASIYTLGDTEDVLMSGLERVANANDKRK